MLEDIVMDAALQSHRETMKSRAVCAVCSTQYAIMYFVGLHFVVINEFGHTGVVQVFILSISSP